ncbi:ABC transporter ATP-binding protein [Paenilisteria newyorkensis]|nr:ABC transporter ATP-binding protein [Listeria newyorkensis]
MESILEVKRVSKVYKDFTLRNISFRLPKGYIMGLIGVNGAGKSTLLKIMMDLVQKNSGDVFIFGKNTKDAMEEIKQDVGFVFDENHFYEHLNCEQMKRIIAPFYRNWDEAEYQNYMKMFELPSNKKIKTLSKGMKMKYSIAIALSHHAKLIIMDEPTAGLDPIVRRELISVLQTVVMKEEVSVIFSTHVTADLERIADFITYIHEGRVFFSEEKDALLEQYVIVKGDQDLLDDDAKSLFVDVEIGSLGFQGLSRQAEEARFYFGEEVIFEKPTLDDIMYHTVQATKKRRQGVM